MEERIREGMMTANNRDGVAIVDVSGGMGHDLVALKKKHSEPPGRFVLQDSPQVIEQVPQPLREGIEFTVRDFHTEQPVQGKIDGNPKLSQK